MNRLLYALLTFLYGSLLFSQEMPALKNADLINKNALVFNFNGLQLNSVNGGIGWKKWTRENKAIFAALQIKASREEKDATQELNGIKLKQIAVQLTGGTEKRFPIRHRLSPYFGGLFGFGYEKFLNKTKPSERLNWPIFEEEYRNETQSTMYDVAAFFIVGVEYFVRNNLSFSGQYQIGGDFRWGEEQNISNVADEVRDISRLDLGVWSSSLMVSIYF